LYEEDSSDIVGQETETGTEGDIERLASILMQFAEYYLAVKLLEENKDLTVVILEQDIAGRCWSSGLERRTIHQRKQVPVTRIAD
jgi:hypothetical protein